MGEEIGRRFTISGLQVKDQANLTLEETSKGLCLKDDVTFTLLIAIFPHMVVMFNKINNLPRLEAILNEAQFLNPIVLINNVVVILGKIVVEEKIDYNSKVKWDLPLDATYVYCRVASILYEIDIYTTIWANKLFPLRVCHN